ncbi:hypothetical protein BB560_004153 [Smittium megazygosporum]|uniref:N-acetyltransferase domain-containing protein n=1 Tax=Smittium megazygosporum TaxID=133381 RepID=A0A2T9Z9Y9_9FUNG|nr:hypothetical protein BB560_004153 [Smittium megazygosporum]
MTSQINYPDPNIKIPERLNIKGEKVVLLAFHENHDTAISKLLSDPITMQYLLNMAKLPTGWTKEEAAERRVTRTLNQSQGTMVNFAIVVKKSVIDNLGITSFEESEYIYPPLKNEKDYPLCSEFDFGVEPYVVVGNVGMQHIDISSARGEVGIIADKRVWGHKISSEAILLVLKYAFETLKFHRIEFVTNKDNSSMRGWLERYCKIQPESIAKDAIFVNNNYTDIYTYALFESDWHSSLKSLF